MNLKNPAVKDRRISEERNSGGADRSSQQLHTSPGLQDGVRPRNRRQHPYLRPVPFNHATQLGQDMDLLQSNKFGVCKLFDQMRAMLPHHPTAPGNPSSLDFNVNGQSFQVTAFDSGHLMFDYVNPNQMFYSLKVEQGNSVLGIERFPDGQERLAGLLTHASARLQDATS